MPGAGHLPQIIEGGDGILIDGSGSLHVSSTGAIGPAGGDLAGTYPDPTVDGIQGRPVSAAAPAVGDVFVWNGAAWVPQAGPAPGGPAGGDLNGTYPNPTVDGLQARPLSAAAPAVGDAIIWTGSTWIPLPYAQATRASLAAVTPVFTGQTVFVREVNAWYQFDAASAVTINPWTAFAGSSAGRWLLVGDTITYAALGGGADDWPNVFGTNGAATALAYKGKVVLNPANGAHQCKTLQYMSSGSFVVGSPGVVVQVTIALGSVFNGPFSASPTDGGVQTTFAANNVAGTATISLTGNLGGALVVGAILSLRGNPAGTSNLRVMQYRVTAVSGAGPYTVTVDRPVLMSFSSGAGDIARLMTSVPSDIKIYGNGMTVQGQCNRFVEFSHGLRAEIRDIRMLAPAASSDLMASFDLGSYDCHFVNIEVDGAGVRTLGIALESAEACSLERCRVSNVTVNGYGIALYDCAICDVLDCISFENYVGLALTADGNLIGCLSCNVIGGSYYSNTLYGINIGNGSSKNKITDVQVNYNAGYGIYINGTNAENDNLISGVTLVKNGSGMLTGIGAKRTIIDGVQADANGNWAILINDECDIDNVVVGPTAGAGVSRGILLSDTAVAHEIRLANLNFQNIGRHLEVNGALTTCKLQGARFSGAGGDTSITVAGKFYGSDLTLTGANVGVSVGAAATVRLSDYFDASGCSTAVSVTAGGVLVAEQCGAASVAVTTANVTLTFAQAQCSELTTTGVLTGNRDVILPTINGMVWDVFNNNTGAFTTTFKTAAGTGIVVAQGKRARLTCDGTNIVRVTVDTP